MDALRASIDDAFDSSIVAHLQPEHPGLGLDLKPTCPFSSPNRRQIDAGFGAEDAALGASAAALTGLPPVDAAGWERQRIWQQRPTELRRAGRNALAGVGEPMGTGREGSSRSFERVGWIAGHTEDVLSALVVRGKIGIAD